MNTGGWNGIRGAMLEPMLSDTHPDAEAIIIAGYRRMSTSQKLQRVASLTQAVQSLALLDIRRRHPTADEREQRLRLASRWLDAATMRQVFSWDPEIMGY
jgi:hypothetical protein